MPSKDGRRWLTLLEFGQTYETQFGRHTETQRHYAGRNILGWFDVFAGFLTFLEDKKKSIYLI